jgi:hypothetical protein
VPLAGAGGSRTHCVGKSAIAGARVEHGMGVGLSICRFDHRGAWRTGMGQAKRTHGTVFQFTLPQHGATVS